MLANGGQFHFNGNDLLTNVKSPSSFISANLSDSHQLKTRKRQPQEAKKLCLVCGDKAYSVNFNVTTCESCKAFFRRNALKKKEFRCQTAGNCDISIQTRRTCKKCRLKKCFEVGMIKEWIMSDEAKLRKKQLIEQNRQKRQLTARDQLGNNMDEMNAQLIEPSTPATITDMYQPLNYHTPVPIIDYGTTGQMNSLHRRTLSSSSSRAFQHASTSAFQSLNLYPTPVYGSVILPIESTVEPDRSISNSTVVAPVEEMIRLPKTFLAALINQCHATSTPCKHKSGLTRPSVIVSNKAIPMSCLCRCRCGAKANWSLSKSEPENVVDDETIRVDSEDEDGDDFEQSEIMEVSSGKELMVSGKSQTDTLLNFNFGLSGAKLLHLSQLLAAFKYPDTPIGRPQDDTFCMPALPPIYHRVSPGETASRYLGMINRLLRFSRGLTSGALKNRTICDLFEASVTELSLLHGVLAYCPETNCWHDKGPNIRPVATDQLAALKGNCYDEHIKFVVSFPRVCKDDIVVMLLLCAITFLNPKRVHMKDKEQVQLMRQFYLDLLRQYLEQKFDAEKARLLFENLLMNLDTCVEIAEKIMPTTIIKFNERDMEPLLIEILGYHDKQNSLTYH